MIIKVPLYEGKDFEKLDYDDLINLIDDLGLTKHNLLDSAGGYGIYGYSFGDIENKPVIYIDGCIHKDHEWRSSYWVVHFMEQILNPDPEFENYVRYLTSKYAFYFIPVTNPDAYVRYYPDRNGANANRVDIAHNFDYKWGDTPEGTEDRKSVV